MKTVIDLIDDVHASAEGLGMDLSVKDVAYLISLFLQGLADNEPHSKGDEWLLLIADELDKIKDQ